MLQGPFTGASMNTVRTFAPAVLERNFEYQWVCLWLPQVSNKEEWIDFVFENFLYVRTNSFTFTIQICQDILNSFFIVLLSIQDKN